MTKIIYLDNSTTTAPSELSISKMLPFLTEHWGIPSAPHQKGQELHAAITDSYKKLYQFMGAHEEDTFVFTSSGAEAVNHIISSVYRDITLTTGRNQFLTTAISEAPAILAIERLEPLGCVAKTIEVDTKGIVTEKAFSEAISPRTALVSIPWGNGLTGVIQPLAEIKALCKQRGILLHLDATHVLGKLYYDLKEIDPDFMTFSGDLFHAPKGTGGLYIKNGISCSPFIVGGSEQGNKRAGPLNVPSLIGLATAAQEALDSRDYLCTEIARLRNKFEMGIKTKIPDAFILFQDQERLPHCTAIAFPGLVNEALLFILNRKGICASIGGGLFQQLSLLLTASQIDPTVARGACSFSLSRYTTEDEVDRAIPLITEAVNLLLKSSNKIRESST